MKNILFFLMAGCFLSVTAAAQVYEGKITYNKIKQESFVVDMPYSTEAVQNGLIEKMRSLGYKPKEEKGLFNKDKGFLIFSDAYLTDISNKSYDYLVKVENKGRRKADESVLYFVLMNENVNVRPSLESAEVEKAKAFLTQLLPYTVAADLELKIIVQEETLAKAEKKLSKLRDDQADLEKKLDGNKKDQEETIADIENKGKDLEKLKAKRSPK